MAALAGLATAGLLTATSAGAASNGQIAIVASDSSAGLSAIVLIPSDRLATSRDSKTLVSGPGMIGNLQWTPDGKTLVYDETVGKRTDLYAIDVASPKRRLLVANLAYGGDGALSPDGTTVAYWQGSGRSVAVYLVGTDGQSRRKLTAGGYPVWSPDGSRLALLSTAGEIETIGANGSGVQLVGQLSPTAVIASLAWAPDGESFLVVTQDYVNSTTVVETISSNGTVLHVLFKTGGIPNGWPPAAIWSPGGTQLAFTETFGLNTKAEDHQNALVANADGSDPHTIDAATGALQLELSWSPDGRSIVTADGDRVRVVRADGTQAKVIAYPGDEHELDDPAWEPLP
jgi:Tol biopolymer transport system component